MSDIKYSQPYSSSCRWQDVLASSVAVPTVLIVTMVVGADGIAG
jgi:hypothetical protein